MAVCPQAAQWYNTTANMASPRNIGSLFLICVSFLGWYLVPAEKPKQLVKP
jgi:hypothetical protein